MGGIYYKYPLGVFACLQYAAMRRKTAEERTRKADMEKNCCHKKTKERSEQEYKDLIHRLNRIEGQIRGIRGMVEQNCYCTDILVQVAAATAALNSFNKVLLSSHIRGCVVETLQKLMK